MHTIYKRNSSPKHQRDPDNPESVSPSVAIVKCDSNRKYFTRHGLHLNNSGKEWLSKQIATQIDNLIKDNNRDEYKIILKLKDESTNMNRNIKHDQNSNLQELDEDHTNIEVASNQNNTRQRVVSDNETVCRTSKRWTEVPISRNNDFYGNNCIRQ